MTTAAIFGCEGKALTERERDFFRESAPWGFILFARNIDTPQQVTALCAELRDTVGRSAPILIDQEGGRVARLKPPHWRGWLPALEQAEDPNLSEEDRSKALALRYEIIGRELTAVGIDVNCAPLLDVPAADGHEIIGDRALGKDAATVTRRGRAVYDGLLRAGVLPVIKHIPGHGRAKADSHLALPVVETPLEELRRVDFAPFAAFADAPLAMTAHVIYTALDADRCATLSPIVIEMIRKELGIDGLLMSDDLSMHALSGSFSERTQMALDAGCDVVLHCNGDMDEMTAIAGALPELAAEALRRAKHAEAMRKPASDTALETLDRDFAALTNMAGMAHV